MDDLSNKIEQRTCVVGILGLGYVGLPLGVFFAEAGLPVLGFDPDEAKRESLSRGESYIGDIPAEQLNRVLALGEMPEPGQFCVAKRNDQLSRCDAIIICVPTPLAKSRDPDMSYILNATKLVKKYLRKDQLIVLESTTYPGTTRELVLPILTSAQSFESGSDAAPQLVVGQDFFLAFSPERVDPGNPKYNTRNTPKVVGGITPRCGKLAARLYGKMVGRIVPVSSTDAAEMTKLLENTFRLINIGLVNEFSIMCKRLNVDVWEVIEAASSKPFGFMPFYPGPGLGGHCIPVDPHYLSWKLRLQDYKAQFIELATEVNSHMPRIVVERVVDSLNSVKKSTNGSKIGILGVAYKKDIEDVRESPSIDIISLLKGKGAQISYHDPFVPELELHNGERYRNSDLSVDWLESLDVLVIVTDHSRFDMPLIVRSSKVIVDTRNAVVKGGCEELGRGKVWKL